MAALVECLACGNQRSIQGRARDVGECPRCGYVGWAPTDDLSEPVRRALRERPLEARRIRIAAVA